MKKIIALLFFITIFSNTYAQPKWMTFDELVHDFGSIKEADGSAKHKFYFTNTSGRYISIAKVESSCGCTTPFYSKDSIPPGGRGFVEAVYDTKGRPGDFSKNVMVYTSGSTSIYYVLTIKGNVIPEANPYANKGSNWYGNMNFDKTTINFNPIYNNQTDSAFIKITNDADWEIKILGVSDLPQSVSVRYTKESLRPKDTAWMVVYYDATKAAFGEGFLRFALVTNDPIYATKYFFIITNVKEYFPPLTKKLLKSAPQLTTTNTTLNLGDVRKGGFRDTQILIKNEGKTDLLIHKIVATCNCVTASASAMVVKPGETATITVKFDSVLVNKGKVNRGFTIISNDPRAPEKTIAVQANVL